MTERLSRGSSRRSRQGPLIVSGFDIVCCDVWMDESSAEVLATCPAPSSSLLAETGGTYIDTGRWLVDRLEAFSAGGVPAVGEDTKSLYELSVVRGSFHGNRRSVMHAKMIAIDQMSVGWGSYLLCS